MREVTVPSLASTAVRKPPTLHASPGIAANVATPKFYLWRNAH